MAKRKPQAKPAVPEWVVTYGDMMSLLLCFFILLSAFSELKKPRDYQKVIDSIKEALGLDGGLGMIHTARNPANSSRTHLPDRAALAGEYRTRAEVNDPNTSGRDETVQTVRQGNRWTIGGRITFAPASAELNDAARAALRTVADEIRGGRRKIELRGHAWGVEDRQEGVDHLDLSYRRARAAAEYLERECGVHPGVLTVVAVGSREPLSTERLEDASASMNRRLEVVVTEVMVAEVHPDPEWQGRDGP